jgi:hypothetical protein
LKQPAANLTPKSPDLDSDDRKLPAIKKSVDKLPEPQNEEASQQG